LISGLLFGPRVVYKLGLLGEKLMARARKEVELAVRMGNSTGALGKLLSILATHQVNVLAYCAYSDRDDAVVLLVPNNPLRAKLVLEEAGYQCKANSVILVGTTDHVGAAAQLGKHLGHAGVDILYSYASSAGTSQFFAVFKTVDDDLAISVLYASERAQAAA
jgi:hypothetical protein